MLQKKLHDKWQFRRVGENAWLPATVPGCVHTDLMAVGRIDDPFYRNNARELQWIETEEWEYQTHFQIDEEWLSHELIELEFEGLDTFADVYVNEKHVLTANNMFHAWPVEIQDYVKPGDNSLRIHFFSPYQKGLEKLQQHPFELPASNDIGKRRVSPFVRKAPYQFGWDWAPRLLTSGIWRPVTLKAWDTASIESVHVVQRRLNQHEADIVIATELFALQDDTVALNIRIDDTLIFARDVKVSKGMQAVDVDVTIQEPRLWWCNGLGEPNLYMVHVELTRGEELLSEKNVRFGLRTIELVHVPDKHGRSFAFRVNGVPVFMKGTNLIPPDFFPSRVTPDHYQRLIQNAQYAGMNMLRCWGGAYYEDDRFYDMCDENGLLVWQDFMFACCMYPADNDFLESVWKEAVYNVKRLRNHPCLALWCGNNEVLEGFYQWGWKEELGDHVHEAMAAYEKIFHKLLPDVIQHYDQLRPYWPSSPSGRGNTPPTSNEGDFHFWDIAKADLPIDVFQQHIGRFMSEYGFKAYPSLDTLRRYSIPEDWQPDNEVMEFHQGWSFGQQMMKNNLARQYRPPGDWFAWVYLSQMLQATALRMAIEAHRRAKPFCMGTLYWQLNDCWPAATWATIDYYGRRKAAYYQVRRSFAEVIVSIVRRPDKLEFWCVSDRLESVKGRLLIESMTMKGSSIFRSEHLVDLQANTSQAITILQISELVSGYDETEIVISARLSHDADQSEVVCTHCLQPMKAMQMLKPSIEMTVTRQADGCTVEIVSDVFAVGVYLSAPDEQASFSDNFFDLLPGRRHRITVRSVKELSGGNMKIYSITDSYKT